MVRGHNHALGGMHICPDRTATRAVGRRAKRRQRVAAEAGACARSLLALPLALVLAAMTASSAHAAEPEVTVAFSCKSIAFTMTGFPNLPKNTVKLQIRVDGVITQKVTYVFNGPNGFYSVRDQPGAGSPRPRRQSELEHEWGQRRP